MKHMKIGVIIGLITLALAWLALALYILIGSGFTLYNLLVVGFSGVIIFVPLWKKYVIAGRSGSRK